MDAVETVRNRKLMKGVLGILMTTLCFHVGCGRKGPPKPPRTITPPAVSDLTADLAGRRIALTWSVPRQGGEVVDGVQGFNVYRFKTSDPEKLCARCPIDFRKFEEIEMDAGVPGEEDRVTLYDTYEPGYGYAYKVLVLHESGGMSKDSNIAKVLP
jgi:hypothetical protein